MRRLWGLGALIAAWALVGLLLVVFAPRDRVLEPERARLTYGEKRTSFSAAPGGLLAFYRMLQGLGFECERLAGFQLPGPGALFLLEPEIWLNPEEAAALIDWVKSGSTLIYAPAAVEAMAEIDGELQPLSLEDPLTGRLSPPVSSGAQLTVRRVGAGRIFVVRDAGERLSNEALFDRGIEDDIQWLRSALEGHRRVYFDEARAGAMLRGGLLSTLSAGSYRWPLLLFTLAVALAFWRSFVREQPAEEATGRDHIWAGRAGQREHLNALARALAREKREGLTREALLLGSAGRLGYDAHAQSEIEGLRRAHSDLGELARALEELEQRREQAR